MTTSRHGLAVGLAAATLALVLQGVILLVVPGFASLVTQAGLAPLLGAWFGPVVPLIALALAVATFVISWNHKSILVVGLLVASGVIFTVTSAIAAGFFAVVVVPGPILGVIFGLVIFGLGAVKGIKSARKTALTARS